MNLYYNKDINKVKTSNFFYFRKLRILEELLFFTCLLLETIRTLNVIKLTADYICLLNYIFIKYIYLNKIKQVTVNELVTYRNTNVSDYLLIFLEIDKIKEEDKGQNEYKQKVVLCKKVSRTRRKGRVCRYKVILITYSTAFTWFGIGVAKDFFLQNAVHKARINSFKNIFSIGSKNPKNWEKIYTKKADNILSINYSKWNILPSSSFFIRIVAQSLKTTNLSIKLRKSTNISRIINSIIY